jgi:hypothetical protein
MSALGKQRTSIAGNPTSAFDPKRTLASCQVVRRYFRRANFPPSTTVRKPVRFLLPLLACLLLSGCATPHWVKPEASKSDLALDQAACVEAVQQPPPAGTTDQQQYEACMNAHGWKRQ